MFIRGKTKSIARTLMLGLLISAGMVASTIQANAYTILKRFHQSAAQNREEADITVIRCSNGLSYYIYSYYRSHGASFRVIIPPHWGKPVGGRDYHYFESAIRAACS